MPENHFGPDVAQRYDQDSSAMFAPEARDPAVDRLAALAAGPPMATTRVEGRFGLVYLVFNTIVNLTSQDAQVACFENAAAHLEPGGCFVVEVGIPQLRRLPPGERGNVIGVEEGYWGIDEFDVVEQRLVSHHFSASDDGIRYKWVPFRFVWPSELDLMARLAGLRLRERGADWHGAPLTSESRSHVSVWDKPAGG